jgi:ParB-like chromosome segregation protein Spo0J
MSTTKEPAVTVSLGSLDEAMSDKPQQATEVPAQTRRTLQLSAECIEQVPKSLIKFDPVDSSKRSFVKEFAEKLAKSIESDGLLHPPILFRSADKSYYTVKAGRHRIYACCKILGWDFVPCIVLEEGDDDLAESIDYATNLFVNPLNEPQSRAAIHRWNEIYKSRQSSKKTTARGTERKNDGFAGELQSALGVGKAMAHRIANTANVITPADREILEGAGVTQSKIDDIAQLKEPEAVQAAVNLTAAGMAPEEAIRKAKKDKEARKAAAKAAAPPKETKPPKPGKPPKETKPPKEAPKKAADMTDEEWLETHCGKLLGNLPFKAAFKRDAILYRRISESLVRFRTGTKKALAEAKHTGENGAFFANIYRIVRAAHPMNWFICEGCLGTGHTPEDKSKQCNKCLGGAYKVKFEEA